MLLGKKRRGHPAFTGEYLSGAARRPGLHDPGPRLPDKMGGAGRADAQYGSDRAGASGQFPPGDRLGRIHGRGDHGAQQPGPAHRVHPVGKSGPAQESHAEQSEAPHPDGASSEPALSVQGVFRQQAVQQDECVSGESWDRAGGLADRLRKGLQFREKRVIIHNVQMQM